MTIYSVSLLLKEIESSLRRSESEIEYLKEGTRVYRAQIVHLKDILLLGQTELNTDNAKWQEISTP